MLSKSALGYVNIRRITVFTASDRSRSSSERLRIVIARENLYSATLEQANEMCLCVIL